MKHRISVAEGSTDATRTVLLLLFSSARRLIVARSGAQVVLYSKFKLAVPLVQEARGVLEACEHVGLRLERFLV